MSLLLTQYYLNSRFYISLIPSGQLNDPILVTNKTLRII